jgi:hypothetical protein
LETIIFPNDPLQFIRQCVRLRKVLWTYHVNMRLENRFIPRQAIVDSHAGYEIIEEYPNDKYMPSCLVRSEYGGEVFHVLFALDVLGDNVRVITAYRPNPDQWEPGFTKRRAGQ